MHRPRRHLSAPDTEEGKDRAGKQNAADHGAAHGKQDKQNKDGLQDAIGGIPSAKDAFAPFSVQNMVQDKQKEHSDAEPLVNRFPYGGVASVHKAVRH